MCGGTRLIESHTLLSGDDCLQVKVEQRALFI